MTDRDRLIELVMNAHIKCSCLECQDDEYCVYESHRQNGDHPDINCLYLFVADYLLANGVIVPPCKVGDKLYIITNISKEIVESVVIGLWMADGVFSLLTIHGTILNDSFGKTVFLTKEEAEKALATDTNVGNKKELGK